MSRASGADWLLLILLVVLWGSAFGLTDIALDGFSPLQLVTGRLWIGAGVLMLVVVAMGQPPPRQTGAWISILAMAVLGNVLPFFLISWGQQNISSGLTGILMAVMPLVVLMLAHFLVPDERMNRWRLAGFLLGFAGIVMLLGADALSSMRGEGTALWSQLSVLAGAVCYGLNVIVARRSPALPAPVMAAWVVLSSAIISTVVTLIAGPLLPSDPGYSSMFAVLALGVLATGVATAAYYRVVAGAGPTFLSLINYLIPVWAVLLGATLLDETLPARSVLALGVILLGVLVSQRGQLRPGFRSEEGR
ncbi:MAG: DMT family transporter [Gammaproteobacteria bacterium]